MNYSGYFVDKDGNRYYTNPRLTGGRNRVYLIGAMNANPSGSGSAGHLVLYLNNMDFYDHQIAGFVNIDKTGKIVISTIVPWTLSSFKKVFYTYSDGNKFYIFIEAPNYNDSWYVEIISKSNTSLYNQSFSPTEFKEYVKNMTLISSA